jgi:hypothetical protein
MAYTKHSWEEKTGSTGGGGDRETWLNNLETQYDEVVSYCTTTLHDTSYYTQAQCDATFYGTATDGTGSGFVAATLDGYTAVQILGSQVQPGTIAIWGASQASIPAGWVLCDGGSGTPNLVNSIPVVAGDTYALGATGGAATVSSSAASVTIAGHAVTTSELGTHLHSGIVDYYDEKSSTEIAYYAYNGTDVAATVYTGYTGGGATHTHSGSTIAGGQGTTGNNWPAYKCYCYIMKS